jgi:hypothetical protein
MNILAVPYTTSWKELYQADLRVGFGQVARTHHRRGICAHTADAGIILLIG